MHRKYSLSMKALLLLTALMVSALPAKADDTRTLNRAKVVGALMRADCAVRNGDITEEQARERMQGYINENPDLNTAYSWATISDKGMEAVKALVPYLTPDCDITLSQYRAGLLMIPYLE